MYSHGKTLFITAFHPGGIGFIGAGEAISEQHLKTLLGHGAEVHVICLAPAYQVANPAIVELCETYTSLVHTRWKALRALIYNRNQGSFIAPWFFTRVCRQNLEYIVAAIQQHDISHVHLDFPSCLGFSRMVGGLPIQYTMHDVVTQKIERKPLLKYVSKPVASIEYSLLSRVSKCYALSEKDASRCRTLGYEGEMEILAPSNNRVGIVTNGRPIQEVISQFKGKSNLVFFGNMRRQENHNSILKFLVTAYPGIWLKNRDVRLWILGLAPRWPLRLLGYLIPGIEVVGAVDDPTLAFQKATVCIAPVYYGAGVKIKVLQMLDAGASVIATAIGAEGIPDSDRLKVVENDQFTVEVNRFLSRHESR